MPLIPELRSSVPDVGITAVSPSHDIKLSDENGNSVGLIFCDRNGRRNPLGVNSGYMPRSPMRISTGSTGYSDQEPPFITEVQSTWVGGRAQADLSTDRTRFADSFTWIPQSNILFVLPLLLLKQGNRVLQTQPLILDHQKEVFSMRSTSRLGLNSPLYRKQ